VGADGGVTRLLYVSADPGVPVLGHKGASVHVRELVTAFVAEGASVVIASPRICPEGDRLDARADLIEITPIVAKQHRDEASLHEAIAFQAREVTAIARCVGATSIYERFSLHSLAGAEAAEVLRLPYVVEVNAPLRDEARRFRSLAYPEIAAKTEARVYAAADRIFVVSKPLAALLRRDGVDSGKLEVLRNAITPAKIPPHRAGAGFTVGFAGSLKSWHGVEVLTDAVRTAASVVHDLRLEVVGDGPVHTLWREIARGNPARARFVGRRSCSLRRHRADLLLLPAQSRRVHGRRSVPRRLRSGRDPFASGRRRARRPRPARRSSSS